MGEGWGEKRGWGGQHREARGWLKWAASGMCHEYRWRGREEGADRWECCGCPHASTSARERLEVVGNVGHRAATVRLGTVARSRVPKLHAKHANGDFCVAKNVQEVKGE